MGTPCILDSNIAVYLIKGGLTDEVQKKLNKATELGGYLSVISKIELLGFSFPTEDTRLKTEMFVNQCTILPLNDNVVNKSVELRRDYKIKLPDAVIAATALVLDFILVSRNDDDFKNIVGLKYLNPFIIS